MKKNDRRNSNWNEFLISEASSKKNSYMEFRVNNESQLLIIVYVYTEKIFAIILTYY